MKTRAGSSLWALRHSSYPWQVMTTKVLLFVLETQGSTLPDCFQGVISSYVYTDHFWLPPPHAGKPGLLPSVSQVPEAQHQQHSGADCLTTWAHPRMATHTANESAWSGSSAVPTGAPTLVTYSGRRTDWRKLTLFDPLTTPGFRACWPRLWGRWRLAGCLVEGLIYRPGSR